ncbi:MAG: class II aldolase/adducin family protein [Paracoccaceae bacterium]
MNEQSVRTRMVAACQTLQSGGLLGGTAGNVSVRLGTDMLITPSGAGPDDLDPRMLARMKIDSDSEVAEGPLLQSSEWRFHRDLYRARPDFGAVVHTHAPFCTILAIARRPIPAVHYMIAAFGGSDIRVADYATYGTEELSTHVVAAMEGRNGCLMANHGMVVGAQTLDKAVNLARELEVLAHQHYHALAIGGGHILSDAQIEDTAQRFAGYGMQHKNTA